MGSSRDCYEVDPIKAFGGDFIRNWENKSLANSSVFDWIFP